MIKKKMSISLCQQLCNSHKNSNISWHLPDLLVHGNYMALILPGLRNTFDWSRSTGDHYLQFNDIGIFRKNFRLAKVDGKTLSQVTTNTSLTVLLNVTDIEYFMWISVYSSLQLRKTNNAVVNGINVQTLLFLIFFRIIKCHQKNLALSSAKFSAWNSLVYYLLIIHRVIILYLGVKLHLIHRVHYLHKSGNCYIW